MKIVNRREVAKFTASEFERRVERARRLMTEEKLDGIMVTSEPNLEYLSGFVTQFAWASPTRPWYFVLPRVGNAVAIIPAIGETNWRATSWCKSLLTWPSPVPENEGLDLLAGASIIMGPTDRKLRQGDILLIDTGAKYAGYYCDFDRNIAIGPPPVAAKRVQDALWRATEAGIAAAVPGNTAADVFAAQAKVLEADGMPIGNVGRFGHGLGKVMTEFPSNKPIDKTPLRPGMVLTIEPSATYGADKILVHEENLVITKGKPDLLTRRAPREMVVAQLS